MKKPIFKLKEIANDISKYIVDKPQETYWEISECVDEIDEDEYETLTPRQTTKQEKEIIYNIVFSALLSFNEFDKNINTEEIFMVIDMASNTIGQFLSYVDGYKTIYEPLSKIIDEWNN